MNLFLYEPYMGIRNVMDKVWRGEFGPVTLGQNVSQMAQMLMDMYQTDDEVIVKASVPGV